MSLKFDKGAKVLIKNTTLRGEVTGAKFAADGSMEVLFCVQYADAEGEVQERYFGEDQLLPATATGE